MADVITSPAPNRGAMEQNERIEELKQLPEVFKERIAQVLSAAYRNNCDTLILGAWGCGVFRNEPLDVANYFKIIINKHFQKVFKKIVFAIYDASKNGQNIAAFESVFKN